MLSGTPQVLFSVVCSQPAVERFHHSPSLRLPASGEAFSSCTKASVVSSLSLLSRFLVFVTLLFTTCKPQLEIALYGFSFQISTGVPLLVHVFLE
jgi:hypothetical protein